DRSSMRVGLAERVAREQHADAAREILVPFDDGHLLAGRREPRDVLAVRTLRRHALQKASPHENGMRPSKRDDPADERQHLVALVVLLPVDPTLFVVLAIGVVVAVLRA